MKKENKKLVKRSKIITQQPKALENPNIIDIESLFKEHPKTSCKLSETMKRTITISQVSGAGKNFDNPLYSETTKTEHFSTRKRL